MHRPQSGAREPQLGAHASQLAPLQQSTSSHIGARRLALLTMLRERAVRFIRNRLSGHCGPSTTRQKPGLFQPHQTPNKPILFALVPPIKIIYPIPNFFFQNFLDLFEEDENIPVHFLLDPLI